REALDLAARADAVIDLVLCDVVMPEMKGPAVVARLRAGRPSVKVLYMSGYTDDALGDLGLGDEGVALIVKPFTPSSLLARVRETLDAWPDGERPPRAQ
ncbi:MAG: response regulator, partial [Polyangiales bacterium]